jgi:hypothetical protein
VYTRQPQVNVEYASILYATTDKGNVAEITQFYLGGGVCANMEIYYNVSIAHFGKS